MHRRIDDAMNEIERSFASVTIAELINEPSRSRPLCSNLCVETNVTLEASGD
jgi:hypothetical protein